MGAHFRSRDLLKFWEISAHISETVQDRHIVTHTHTFNGPFSGTTRVSRYQKGKTSLDFTEARDSEWQWHQLSHVQVCTSLQTHNHASTLPLSFYHAMLCIRGTSHGPVSVCVCHKPVFY